MVSSQYVRVGTIVAYTKNIYTYFTSVEINPTCKLILLHDDDDDEKLSLHITQLKNYMEFKCEGMNL